MTLSMTVKTTLSIMTINILTFNVMIFNLFALHDNKKITLNIMTSNISKLSIKTRQLDN
jgi:hypothetical protein